MGVPQKFINSLQSGMGIAKPSHFYVQIFEKTYENESRQRGESQLLVGSNSHIQENVISLRCHQAILPGITAATSQYGTGMPEKNNPYRATFEDVAFSFYCSENLIERDYFETWATLIFNTLNKEKKRYENWQVAYREEFTKNIEIIKLSQTGHATRKYTLHNAFPTILNDTTLDWGDEEVLKMEVTMSYDWWTSTTRDLPDMKVPDPGNYMKDFHPKIHSKTPTSFFDKPLEDWPEPRSQSGPAVSSSDPKSFGLTKDKGNWIKRNLIGTDEF
tara:strand:+ start:36720 stop:37541 length:822 start_codon:yes stop_codon:yes gene_type:complete